MIVFSTHLAPRDLFETQFLTILKIRAAILDTDSLILVRGIKLLNKQLYVFRSASLFIYIICHYPKIITDTCTYASLAD